MRCNSRGLDPERVDRECGFLTETEREYLLGEWDPNGDAEEEGITQSQHSRKKSEILTRTRHALADLTLLQKHADEDMKDRIIKRNVEPDVFDEESLDYMTQGMLWLASEAAVNERFEPLLRAVADDEVNNVIYEMWDALESGDVDKFQNLVNQNIENYMK